jgi:rhodanese-related sulfurtransferase
VNNMNKRGYLYGILTVILILSLAVFLTGCTDVTYNIDNPTAPPVTQDKDQFETTRVALDTYFSSGAGPVITASSLFDNLNDGDTSNDPVVISVRSFEHYQLGHIPGAINIPWKEIAYTSSLSKITAGKDIVCYCYTGHTGAVATTVLNSLGYNAQNMKFGMCSWTTDADVRATKCFDEATDTHDFPIETTANTLPASQTLPVLNNTTSQDDFEIVRAAAEAYTAGTIGPVITAQDLFDNLNDGDTSNDPIVISARSAEHYAIGHVPGAINIPWKSSATVAELRKIDPSKDIVVYCYTGHTGGVETTVLNMLGYSAKNLKWGMCSWTTDADVRATKCFDEATDANDYAVNTGVNP